MGYSVICLSPIWTKIIFYHSFDNKIGFLKQSNEKFLRYRYKFCTRGDMVNQSFQDDSYSRLVAYSGTEQKTCILLQVWCWMAVSVISRQIQSEI